MVNKQRVRMITEKQKKKIEYAEIAPNGPPCSMCGMTEEHIHFINGIRYRFVGDPITHLHNNVGKRLKPDEMLKIVW